MPRALAAAPLYLAAAFAAAFLLGTGFRGHGIPGTQY